MSRRLISRSPDLKQLQDEGYDLEVRAGYLLIKEVPYVSAARTVNYGMLVSQLELNGDVTAKPTGHDVWFSGDVPCNKDGNQLVIVASSGHRDLGNGIEVDHQFSRKPGAGYADYHHKMS